MYVSLTRFTVDAEVGMDNERIDEVISVTRQQPGWLGAYVFRDPDDPSKMLRFTYWETLEARDALYDSPGAQAIGLTERPQGREVLVLVRADTPDDSSGTPAPPVA